MKNLELLIEIERLETENRALLAECEAARVVLMCTGSQSEYSKLRQVYEQVHRARVAGKELT